MHGTCPQYILLTSNCRCESREAAFREPFELPLRIGDRALPVAGVWSTWSAVCAMSSTSLSASLSAAFEGVFERLFEVLLRLNSDPRDAGFATSAMVSRPSS